MNITIFGSTDLTKVVLDAILEMGMNVNLVVTTKQSIKISYAQNENKEVQNFRHIGIDDYCKDKDIKCLEFTDNKSLVSDLKDIAAEEELGLCIVAGWYHMVPESVRSFFSQGCVGLHASKLPELKGGAPLNWAILLGLKETAVSLFALSDGVDEGDLWDQEVIPLDDRETIQTLVEKSQRASVEMITRTLKKVEKGEHQVQPQEGKQSFGLQRCPDDGRIIWEQSAEDIDRLVRAVTKPYPGAFTELNNKVLTIWESKLWDDSYKIHGAAGQIFVTQEKRVLVVTGQGCLEIIHAEFEGGEDAMPDLLSANHQRCSRTH